MCVAVAGRPRRAARATSGSLSCILMTTIIAEANGNSKPQHRIAVQLPRHIAPRSHRDVASRLVTLHICSTPLHHVAQLNWQVVTHLPRIIRLLQPYIDSLRFM
jgi:hypothetical protein